MMTMNIENQREVRPRTNNYIFGMMKMNIENQREVRPRTNNYIF